MKYFDFSFIFPCLNESETLLKCIEVVRNVEKRHNVKIEIIVADNGSTDGSQEICKKSNVKLIEVAQRGYGATLDTGIRFASSNYVVIADSDLSYDIQQCKQFVDVLINTQSDLVIGNRFKGQIHKKAMPWHHKYIGNPVLSFIGRKLFGVSIGDFHCGMRALRKESYMKANPKTKGMEYATEMIVQFAAADFKILEIPTSLFKDGRNRKPHLRSFRDGWRHLRMMILFAPHKIFLLPGLILAVLSTFVILIQILSNIDLIGINLDPTFLGVAAFGLVFSTALFCLGSLNIATAKVKRFGEFKYSLIRYSRFRELISIIIPTGIMMLGVFGFLKHEFIASNAVQILPYYFSFIEFSIGSQLLITALAIRAILSDFW